MNHFLGLTFCVGDEKNMGYLQISITVLMKKSTVGKTGSYHKPFIEPLGPLQLNLSFLFHARVRIWDRVKYLII